MVGSSDQPDVRAALAFPAGWRLEAADDSARRQAHALAIDERCEVGVRRSDVDDFEVTVARGSGYIFLGRETVELPAGPAERVDFAANDEGGRWSVYAVWDAGFVHELWCRGDELPGDRWLSIAQTLDIEPAAEAASSPFGPVVERTDAGMAMSFGEDRHVRGSSTNQGLLYATSPTAVCAVSDYSAVPAAAIWTGVDDMHDEYVAIAQSRDNLLVTEAAYLDLAAGRTGLADIAFGDGRQGVRYSFADGEGTFVALFCVGDPTPDDRYLSLAASLEWLPAD